MPPFHLLRLGVLSEGFRGARARSEKHMSHQKKPHKHHESETNLSHNRHTRTHTHTHTQNKIILSDSYLTLSSKSPKCGFIVTFIKIRLFLVLFLDFINKIFLSLVYVCLFIISCGKEAKILSMRFDTPGKFPCSPIPLVMPNVGIPPKFRFPYIKKPSWSITCCKLRPVASPRPPAGVTLLLLLFENL